jgi:hypothetical protein
MDLSWLGFIPVEDFYEDWEFSSNKARISWPFERLRISQRLSLMNVASQPFQVLQNTYRLSPGTVINLHSPAQVCLHAKFTGVVA